MLLNKFIPWSIRRYLKRICGIPDMWNVLYHIKRNNFKPQTIFDIGAYKGNWTKDCKKIFPKANYYLFEPQNKMIDNLKRLESKSMIIENLFLGSEDGLEIEFYEAGSSSSALKFGHHKPIKKVITTLDKFCKSNSISAIDILKLDVQGYELEIFKGASLIMKSTDIILAEVSLIDIYVGSPLVNDIIHYLKEKNFLLFDIADFRRRSPNNHLWQCDMFFVKKNLFY